MDTFDTDSCYSSSSESNVIDSIDKRNHYVRCNAPLWNEWVGLSSDAAFETKVHYSNMANDDSGYRQRLVDFEFIHLEQMYGISEAYSDDGTARNPYYMERGGSEE